MVELLQCACTQDTDRYTWRYCQDSKEHLQPLRTPLLPVGEAVEEDRVYELADTRGRGCYQLHYPDNDLQGSTTPVHDAQMELRALLADQQGSSIFISTYRSKVRGVGVQCSCNQLMKVCLSGKKK